MPILPVEPRQKTCISHPAMRFYCKNLATLIKTVYCHKLKTVIVTCSLVITASDEHHLLVRYIYALHVHSILYILYNCQIKTIHYTLHYNDLGNQTFHGIRQFKLIQNIFFLTLILFIFSTPIALIFAGRWKICNVQISFLCLLHFGLSFFLLLFHVGTSTCGMRLGWLDLICHVDLEVGRWLIPLLRKPARASSAAALPLLLRSAAGRSSLNMTHLLFLLRYLSSICYRLWCNYSLTFSHTHHVLVIYDER